MKTSLIILNYNKVILTQKCVGSLLPYINKDKDVEVILVDDGSSDATPNYLKSLTREDSRFIPVLLKRNSGIMKARNEGLIRARGDFILFLDNDTVWQGDILKPLLDVVTHRDQAGVVGMCGIIMPNLFTQIHLDQKILKLPMPVTAVTGYCFGFLRNLVQLGLRFEEKMMVAQGEDIEFCLQAKSHNLLSYAVPHVPLNHMSHGSLATYKNKFQKILCHNLKIIENKWQNKLKLPDPLDCDSLYQVLAGENLVLRKTDQIDKYTYFDILPE